MSALTAASVRIDNGTDKITSLKVTFTQKRGCKICGTD